MSVAMEMEGPFGFRDTVDALVIGGVGGIGGAFVDCLEQQPNLGSLHLTSRQGPRDGDGVPLTAHHYDLDLTREESIVSLVNRLTKQGVRPNLILNCTGLLHSGRIQPERSLRELDAQSMMESLQVNTIGVALLLKHLLPLMPKHQRCVFASLSARVGSISDNRLGGWYAYRASKAAQNMIVRTAAIEARLKMPKLICVQLHPGTVDTGLSAPFTKRLKPQHEVFSPERAAQQLRQVISGLTTHDSGAFFAWNGESIPW